MEKKDIVSYNYDELQDEIKSIGEKPFRAKQIYAWLHEKLAEEFDEMTNLSKALREKLDQAPIRSPRWIRQKNFCLSWRTGTVSKAFL